MMVRGGMALYLVIRCLRELMYMSSTELMIMLRSRTLVAW